MGSRPLTTLLTVGLILLLAWLWRNRRLEGLFDALLRPVAGSPSTAPIPAPSPGAPRGGVGGGLIDLLRGAEGRRQRKENPSDPILPDDPRTDPPGTTWRPKLLVPYPNDYLSRMMN